MRRLLMLASLASAVLGAVVVLVLGSAFGLLGKSSRAQGTKTVVIRQRIETGGQASPAARSTPNALRASTFDARRIYAQRSPGVVTVFSFFGSGPGATESQGSGFVVSRDGVILTDAHVITNAGTTSPGQAVEAAEPVFVEFGDHDRIPAHIVGWDVFDDVGVLKVDPAQHRLHVVPLGESDSVAVGDPVAAIGSPLGNENSLSVGVVSAIHRSIASLTSRYSLIDAIQTDAPITHGNSGGPLLDSGGRVIGINAQIRSQSGSGNDAGVGFAVPVDSAKRSMRQLLHGGRVRYAYVGLTSEDLTPSLARRLKLPVSLGALVDGVAPGGPADRAGLHGGTKSVVFEGDNVVSGGDIVVAIDGRRVASAADLVRIVTEDLLPGRLATFSIIRGGERRKVAVRLSDRPLNPHAP